METKGSHINDNEPYNIADTADHALYKKRLSGSSG